MMPSALALYALAALAEIAGCFAVWSVVRGGRSAWWLAPGVASLVVFAWLLTRVDLPAAGRTYAAYGGIYIVASLGWLVLVERVALTRADLVGGALALAGCTVILAGPR